jgi:membrane fusion protein (multidrug efflux system)
MKNITFPARHPVALIALGLAVFLAACGDRQAAPGGAGGASGAPGAPGSTGAPPAPRFAAVVLQPSAASSGISATGTVLAEQEVNVQAEISGKVVGIGFREGGAVTAGQILVELDGAELKAQADRAEASLMLAKTRAERMRADFQAQAVSQNENDQAVAALKTAQAEAALTKAQWEKTRIRAPFGGTAGLREVELGSVVQPGARVTSLQNLASLRVEFSVPERQAGSVHSGMKVRFTAAGSVDTLEATVYGVESRIDPDTRLVRVRARAQNTPARTTSKAPGKAGGESGRSGRVLPGAFARVELPLRADSALWVPAEAVVQSARGSQVWVARGGIATAVVFTPGLRTPDAVEAAAGLKAGDTIFTSGLMQLRPGVPAIPVVAGTAPLSARAPRSDPASTTTKAR